MTVYKVTIVRLEGTGTDVRVDIGPVAGAAAGETRISTDARWMELTLSGIHRPGTHSSKLRCSDLNTILGSHCSVTARGSKVTRGVDVDPNRVLDIN